MIQTQVPWQETQWRPMASADLPNVAAIEVTVHLNPWTMGNFEDALVAGYVCRVALIKQKILGYLVMMEVLDQAEILNIAVAKEMQQQGLGEWMLGQARQIASQKEIKTIYLEVRPSNQQAVTLYQNFGFKMVGLRPNYYPSYAHDKREDAWQMALFLPN